MKNGDRGEKSDAAVAMSPALRRALGGALRGLGTRIITTVSEAKTSGKSRPTEETYLKWHAKGFRYTAEGPKYRSLEGQDFKKPEWFRARHPLFEEVTHFDEYKVMMASLSGVVPDGDNASRYLKDFAHHVIRNALDNDSVSEKQLNGIIRSFLGDISNEEQISTVTAWLSGPIIGVPQLKLRIGGADILLRQSRVRDIEREEYPFSFHPRQPGDLPTAILVINRKTRGGHELQREVSRAVCVLRLFRVCSVVYSHYDMSTKSITGSMLFGTLYPAPGHHAIERATLAEKDVAQLAVFWPAIAPKIPEGFLELGAPRGDARALAYMRYCDALLTNGLFERRVANAVMALEALLLGTGDNQELAYRLSMRIGALANALSLNPLNARAIVAMAYPIRSHFVHGGALSDKTRHKLQGQYGDEKKFMRQLLEQVRLSITAFLCVDMGKKDMLRLLDDSMLSESHRKRLGECVGSARTLLNPGIENHPTLADR